MSDFIMDTHRVARAKSCFNHLLNMQFSDIENSKFHRSTNFQISKIVIRGYQRVPAHLVHPQTSLVLANWTFRQTALSISFIVFVYFVFVIVYCTSIALV